MTPMHLWVNLSYWNAFDTTLGAFAYLDEYMEEILAQYKPNMTPAMLRQPITTAVKILPSILAKHSASNRIPSRNNKKCNNNTLNKP